MLKATIIRHPKERLSKCSLEPLRNRTDLEFFKALPDLRVPADEAIVLAVGAPPLAPADAGRRLLLLDSTWRLLPDLERCLVGEGQRRSLPAGLRTAYPRISKIGENPEGGLASVEALYAALWVLGQDVHGILDGYFWAGPFLEINSAWLAAHHGAVQQ